MTSRLLSHSSQTVSRLSSFDVRQNLTFNYLWEIPAPGFAKEGALKRLADGWQLGGIYHARTGVAKSRAGEGGTKLQAL